MPCSDASAPSDPEASLGSSATPANSSHIPWAQPDPSFGDFALFIDSMSMSYANSLSALFVDQPFLSFSPSPLFGALDPQPSCAQWQNPNAVPSDMVTKRTSAPHLFDEFSSTFPSFEPPSSAKTRQEPWKITQLVWDHLLAEIQNCISVIPPEFSLPSRHTMTRYTATYFSGFHRHLPFLHVPTFSPAKCPIELILAMAAIGAQSNFDNDNAVMFFRTSHAIILERLRYRKAELCKRSFPMGDGSSIELRPPNSPASARGLPPGSTANQTPIDQFDPVSAVQALLLLMAMATWGNSKAIYNEAVGLQNTLANLVREEKFLEAQTQTPKDITWSQWVHVEGFKRTIAIIFCFFIFHTIVYDTPPSILNSELNIYLPSREIDWASRSEKDCQETRKKSEPESQFQSCFSLLFSKPIPYRRG